MYIAIALVILTAVGVVMTTFDTGLIVFFRRRGRFFSAGPRQRAIPPRFPRAASSPVTPVVSIIKPVCGLDDELETNLQSFARLRGVPFELIVSVADAHDPALPVVERVRAAHPAVAWKVVIGGDPSLERWNRKVARLIAAERHARGRIVMISDSNVRVEPDDVARTVAGFDDPRVGCVSNLFTGAGADSFGARIESLHLLSFVAAGTVLAAFAGVPCVVGKSMAITRDALNAIGGFGGFEKVLAEDQAIALAVTRAGYQVRLSPVAVRNVVVHRTLRRALDRQIRWNKIRYAFSRATYTAELLLQPLPFAVAAALAGASPLLPLAVALLRVAQIAASARATGADLDIRSLALVPLLDLLQFGAQFVPYADDRVTWRGHTARIGPDTVLIEVPAAA